jgi:hypothetical protein
MPFVTELVYEKTLKFFNFEHGIVCSKYDEEYPNRLNKEYSFVRFVNYKKLIVIYEFDSRRAPGRVRYISDQYRGHGSAIIRWKYRYLIFENHSQALITIECDNKGDHAGEATLIELELPNGSLSLAENFIKLFEEFYFYKCTSWDGLSPEAKITLDKSILKIVGNKAP